MLRIPQSTHRLNRELGIPHNIGNQWPPQEVRSRMQEDATGLALFPKGMQDIVLDGIGAWTGGNGFEGGLDGIVIDGDAGILFVELRPGVLWDLVSVGPLCCITI